jgi:hypothetical protein
MSPTTLRIIIAGVLFVHGVGHIMGLLPIVGLSTIDSWNAQSWLLTGILGDTFSRAIAFVLFLVPTIGFVGAALALMDWLVPHAMWRSLALYSSIISLVAIFLFWNGFVTLFPNKIGAIAVDVITLVALIWASWPTEAQIGY